MICTRCPWLCIVLATACGAGACAADTTTSAVGHAPIADTLALPTHFQDWPTIRSHLTTDPTLNARVHKIVASMPTAQKLGQMTRGGIKAITSATVATAGDFVDVSCAGASAR